MMTDFNYHFLLRRRLKPQRRRDKESAIVSHHPKNISVKSSEERERERELNVASRATNN